MPVHKDGFPFATRGALLAPIPVAADIAPHVSPEC